MDYNSDREFTNGFTFNHMEPCKKFSRVSCFYAVLMVTQRFQCKDTLCQLYLDSTPRPPVHHRLSSFHRASKDMQICAQTNTLLQREIHY